MTYTLGPTEAAEPRYCPIEACAPMVREYADPHTSCGHEAALWRASGKLAELLAPAIMRGTVEAIRDDRDYPPRWAAVFDAAMIAERLPCDISRAVDSGELVEAIGRPQLGEDRWQYAGRLREAMCERICAEPAR
jgi:hypothetical protein